MTDTVNLRDFHKSNKLILGGSDLDLEQMSQQNILSMHVNRMWL